MFIKFMYDQAYGTDLKQIWTRTIRPSSILFWSSKLLLRPMYQHIVILSTSDFPRVKYCISQDYRGAKIRDVELELKSVTTYKHCQWEASQTLQFAFDQHLNWPGRNLEFFITYFGYTEYTRFIRGTDPVTRTTKSFENYLHEC